MIVKPLNLKFKVLIQEILLVKGRIWKKWEENSVVLPPLISLTYLFLASAE